MAAGIRIATAWLLLHLSPMVAVADPLLDFVGEVLRRFEPSATTPRPIPYRGNALFDSPELNHYKAALQSALAQKPASLPDLLKPLFQSAASRALTADPAAENRTLLTVMGLYAIGPRARALIGADRGFASTSEHPVRLRGREDLSRHFLVSAAVSANADHVLARTAGLYKEMEDSHGGSGFSFVDLAADHAGTRFGTIATASARGARRVQLLTAAGLNDKHLLPAVHDLPENLSAQTFKRGFGEVDSERYRRMVDLIDRRIGALPLYRTP